MVGLDGIFPYSRTLIFFNAKIGSKTGLNIEKDDTAGLIWFSVQTVKVISYPILT